MFFQNSKGKTEFAKSPNHFDHKKSFYKEQLLTLG